MPVLYLTEPGATLRKDGEVFCVTKDDVELARIPAIRVEQVVVLGNINLTTPVIAYLLQQGIDCVFCNSYGKYHGRLVSTASGFGRLRQLQLQAATDPGRRLSVARQMVRGKMLNQRTLLMRHRRERELASLDSAIAGLERALSDLDAANSIGSLFGIEGNASVSYFRAFGELLQQDMGFNGRQKRPPPDPVNSLLSFGYTLLVYNIESAVYTAGLDPYQGFLHAAEYSRPSLVLDLVEEFRPIIVDSLVLRIINTRVLTETDFQRPSGENRMVVLTQEAIKKFVQHYEERVQTQIRHPLTGNQVSYRRCFELQVRHLASVLQRPEAEYQPFLVR